MGKFKSVHYIDEFISVPLSFLIFLIGLMQQSIYIVAFNMGIKIPSRIIVISKRLCHRFIPLKLGKVAGL